jgi:hypothetical protein
MWKIVLILLGVTALMLSIRILYDPPVIETRAGMIVGPELAPLQITYAYSGVRG